MTYHCDQRKMAKKNMELYFQIDKWCFFFFKLIFIFKLPGKKVPWDPIELLTYICSPLFTEHSSVITAAHTFAKKSYYTFSTDKWEKLCPRVTIFGPYSDSAHTWLPYLVVVHLFPIAYEQSAIAFDNLWKFQQWAKLFDKLSKPFDIWSKLLNNVHFST